MGIYGNTGSTIFRSFYDVIIGDRFENPYLTQGFIMVESIHKSSENHRNLFHCICHRFILLLYVNTWTSSYEYFNTM